MVSINQEYEKAPSSIARSPIKLAQYLTENDSSEFQQALNIYTWIVNNIKYDVKALESIKSKTYSPKQTLKRKKGICYQYSALFASLCQNAGISSREVIGYSRGFIYHKDDPFFEADHSWNGVKLDSSWYLVDATWGSGVLHQKKRWFKELQFRWFKKPYINDKYKFKLQPNYDYFLVNPKSLITDHLPVDPNWQLVDFPISIITFESSAWKSYLERIDSLYQKQIDSTEYVMKLDKYEYLSDLQYLQSTAEQSYLFNPKNSKLTGLSSYSIAKSYENASGSLTKRTEAYGHAIKLHKLAISHLKRHQKTATSESKELMRIVKIRISNELTQPINRRVKANDLQSKAALSFLNKEQKIFNNHKGQILKLQKAIARGYRPFVRPTPSRIEKPELVEKNKSEIENVLTNVSNYQDSVRTLIKSIHLCTEVKRPLQKEIVSQYRKLPDYFTTNMKLITQNLGLNEVSKSMQAIDSIGQIIDSLSIEIKLIDRRVRQEKSLIKQLHSSIISQSAKMQKMIIQNCQLSKKETCEGVLYDFLSQGLKSIYDDKLHLESEYLQTAEYDGEINRRLKEITEEVNEVLITDSKCISLFQERRLSGISFKLQKTLFETDQLIDDSQKSVRRLGSKVFKLENEIRRSKSM